MKMFATLYDEHHQLLSTADAYLAALRQPAPSAGEIPRLRAQLGTILMRHRTAEETLLLGPFLAAGGYDALPAVLGHVQTIRDEWLAYSEHVRSWTPQMIEADRPGYIAAVAERVKVLHAFAEYEEREVHDPIISFLDQRQ
jgi:hypothetical protein